MGGYVIDYVQAWKNLHTIDVLLIEIDMVPCRKGLCVVRTITRGPSTLNQETVGIGRVPAHGGLRDRV